MSSSVLSSNNCCGPVTGLLGNQTFLLHTQPQQKTISSPIWRTFYAPPSASSTDDENCLIGINGVSVSPRLTPSPSPNTTAQQIAVTLESPSHRGNRNNFEIPPTTSNLPSQRMTLQKLPNSIIENTTQGSGVNTIQQSSIMSVSKLVRPTPKNQHTHPHHHHLHHNHNQNHNHNQQQQHHVTLHQHQHQHQHEHEHHHQLSSAYSTEVQSGPMNLVTNTQSLDSARSRPSSTSSVDIESDDIPETQQHTNQPNIGGVVVSNAHAQVPPTIPAAYQLNYNHLYANKPGYHNNAVAAAADTLRLHASYSYAIAAVAAAATASSTNNNIFPMNSAMSPPSLSHHQPPTPTPTPTPTAAVPAAHLTLAPPLPLTSTITTTAAVPINVSSRLNDHSQQEQSKQRMNINENMFSPPTGPGLSNGTYLNCKSSLVSDVDSSSENYFKVPNTSGKEGSLKHRILTRPALLADKDEKQSKNAVISTYNSTANFKKGSYIELANGVLRRVEDMRTEDFIQCAERSLHLQLAESTVVKIDSTKPHMVIITFSYDRNRSKADIEVSVDHPFFVYGQGWASCNPEKSHKAFGLKCQRLQVGDICISLTQRTTPVAVAPSTTIKTELTNNMNNLNSKDTSSADAIRYDKSNLSSSCEGISVPLTIKSELQTVMPPPPSFSAQIQYQHQHPHQGNANSAVVHRVPPAPPMHYIPCHLPATSLPPHHQLTYSDFPDLVAAAAAYSSGAHLHHLPTVMPPPPSPDAINGFYQQTQQLFLQGKVTAADLRLQPPSSSTAALSYCPPRSALLPPPPPTQSPMLEHTQEQPFDASIARKRRWSAPEGDCDEMDDRRADHCPNSKLYKTVTAPVTT